MTYYDGTGYTQLPSNAALDLTGSYTLCCWFYLNYNPASLDPGGWTDTLQYAVGRANDLGLGVFMVGAGGANTQLAPQFWWHGRRAAGEVEHHTNTASWQSQSFGARKWHFCATTVNLGTAIQRWAIDGTYPVGADSATITQLFGAGTTWRIGYGDGTTQFFIGRTPIQWRGGIAYVAVFNAALTAAQLATIWQAGANVHNGAVTDYANSVLTTPGLLHYLPLTDASGATTTSDVFGQSAGSHVNAVAGQSGAIGPAVQYNGTTARTNLNYGYASAASVPTTLTIDGWVNPSDLTAAAAAIVARGDQAASTLNYYLGKNAGDGRLAVIVKLDATLYSYVSTAALVANAWQHVGLVLQGGQAPIVTLNGVQSNLDVGTAITQASLNAATTSAVVRIGAAQDTVTNFLPGSVQQIAVRNQALPVSSLLQLYNTGLLAQGRTNAV